MALPDYNDNAARSHAVEQAELEARDDAITEAAKPVMDAKLADGEWLSDAIADGEGYDLSIQVMRELAQGRLSDITARRMHELLNDTAAAEADEQVRAGGLVDDLNF